MAQPLVAIIGRPNVGKSSLFNRIIGTRKAVVDDFEGITRDRLYGETTWNGFAVRFVDTGGIIPRAGEPVARAVKYQVDIAITEASLVLFLVDAGTGPTDMDEEIARDLRRYAFEKTIVLVNKAESPVAARETPLFFSLGLGTPLPISALHGHGVGDVLDTLVSRLKHDTDTTVESETQGDVCRIAVVGRPNAGKSFFVNRLLKENRMIVDSAPGTTRDAVDTLFTHNNRSVLLVDTAGLRKKSRVREPTEYYANRRALLSIQRSDVCLVMIDTLAGMSQQDCKIVEHVRTARKGMVICWNKWDALDKDHKTFDLLCREVRNTYPDLRSVPMIATSAKTGQRVFTALENSLKVNDRMTILLPATHLSTLFRSWTTVFPHPAVSNKSVRMFDIKQRPSLFPLFHVFTANHKLVTTSYRRYLRNKLHESFDLAGCPIVLEFLPPG